MKQPLVSLVVVSLSLSANGSAVADSGLPEGWRSPLSGEPIATGESHATTARVHPSVRADFDGDGIVDTAVLLRSTVFSGQGLLVKLSSAEGDGWLVLDEVDWGEDYPSDAVSAHIAVGPPGTFHAACDSVDADCNVGQAREITTDTPVLVYSRSAGASSMFHWDSGAGAFRRTLLDD